MGAEAATYYFLKHFLDFVQLHYNEVAIIVVGISTSLITITFFNVYLTAMDTIYCAVSKTLQKTMDRRRRPTSRVRVS